MNAVTRNAVVVGLDRSDPGRAAVEYAADLANRWHRPLRLVRAFEPSQYAVGPTIGWTPNVEAVLRDSAQRLLDETAELLALAYPDLVVETSLVTSSATEALVEESHRAHTLVVGSRGAGGFAGLVIGSTTLHLTSLAACPVIAVPGPPDVDAPRRGVIVGVDGSPLSDAAIEYAFEVAADVGENLTAVHAWQDPTPTGLGIMLPLFHDPVLVAQEERLVLAESMAGWQAKFPDVEVEHTVVLGHAVPALVSRAANARLLVVGSRGLGLIRSLVLGSVSHGVLHHATGPVAVVRHVP